MEIKPIPFEESHSEQISDKISRCYVYGEKGMLARLELKKGAIIPEHHHPNEQITYIVSGAVKVTIQGKDCIVRSGEVLIIPSDTPHRFEALEDTIDIDVFTPPREDWIKKMDNHLKK